MAGKPNRPADLTELRSGSSGHPLPWTTGVTWAKIADELDLPTLGTFTGPAGTFRQTAELTKTQRDLLAKLKIPHEENHRGNPASP